MEHHHALLVSKGYHKVSDEGGMFNDEEVYHHKTKPAAIHAGVTNDGRRYFTSTDNRKVINLNRGGGKMHKNVHDAVKMNEEVLSFKQFVEAATSITESLQESAADLNDALKDLKNTLASDGYSPNVVKQVADDWDVNPALLARKFKEATGKDPQDFQMADKESLGKAQFEAGKRKAREWVAKNIRGGESPLEGKPFTFVDKKANQSYQLVASAWTGTKLHAWNITKNSFWEITFPNIDAAAKYIDAHLLSVK